MAIPTEPNVEHEEDLLDEALAETFPASDVPHPAVHTEASREPPKAPPGTTKRPLPEGSGR